MKKYNEATAHEYDSLRSGHLLNRRFEIIRDLIAAVKNGRPLKIAEIGAGTGIMSFLVASHFADCQVSAFDVNEGFVSYAGQKYKRDNLSFQTIDIEKSGGRGNFDVVITVDILHHLGDIASAVSNIGDRLKVGGSWIILEPNVFNFYIYLFQLLAKNEGLFSQSKTEKIFDEGFKIAEKKYAFIIHSIIKQPPGWLAELERRLENRKFLG
ncbi:MAG: class I SAM-dependent methyltransferase, partial [Candidatus Margulisbacteria bacterium]|nr:class I SAM-dependent methyltransferase [Candidatus Margulisiibacteriota bacterium]